MASWAGNVLALAVSCANSCHCPFSSSQMPGDSYPNVPGGVCARLVYHRDLQGRARRAQGTYLFRKSVSIRACPLQRLCSPVAVSMRPPSHQQPHPRG